MVLLPPGSAAVKAAINHGRLSEDIACRKSRVRPRPRSTKPKKSKIHLVMCPEMTALLGDRIWSGNIVICKRNAMDAS